MECAGDVPPARPRRPAPVYWPASRASINWRSGLPSLPASSGAVMRSSGLTRREAGTGRADRAALDRSFLINPAIPAPLKHADRFMTIVGEGPPEPGGKLASIVIHGDDVGAVANAALGHRLGESTRRGNLSGNGIVRVNDITSPVDLNGSRDVTGQVPSGGLGSRHGPRLVPGVGHDVSSHVHHAQISLVQMSSAMRYRP